MAEVVEDCNTTQHQVASREIAGQHLRMIARLQAFADELAARPNLGLSTPPLRELQRVHEIGLLLAPFPPALGGTGLGIVPGTHGTLLRMLAVIGSADLALGRIVEGHINGVLLLLHYGTHAQVEWLAGKVQQGSISGVWNTGAQIPLRLRQDDADFVYSGLKTFCTGAGFVGCPIVTAELDGAGWQMTLPEMDRLGAVIDRSFWHPMGMESSESFGVDFSGCKVPQRALVGAPGDFYRDPIFRGGAVRFASVQAGAVLRLHALFAQWLEQTQRGGDPFQLVRLGELAIAAQQCALWIERAGNVLQCLYQTDRHASERMVQCANMMRTAIEKIASDAMRLVTTGVGARGLLQPHRFERILRDLTMYLRQPAPDETLVAIGKLSLRTSSKRPGGTAAGLFSDEPLAESLPSAYFERIYAQHDDPWNFAFSPYEHDKYDKSLNALPRPSYANAIELGCSIGVLTERLAGRCSRLLAVDVADRALELAEQRCAGLKQVRFAKARVPDELPDGMFDLIVLSEVAYYWQMPDLERAATLIAARMGDGGHLLLVHLTERVEDYPLTGDEVHNYLLRRPEWISVRTERHHRFRLDVLERRADVP